MTALTTDTNLSGFSTHSQRMAARHAEVIKRGRGARLHDVMTTPLTEQVPKHPPPAGEYNAMRYWSC